MRTKLVISAVVATDTKYVWFESSHGKDQNKGERGPIEKSSLVTAYLLF